MRDLSIWFKVQIYVVKVNRWLKKKLKRNIVFVSLAMDSEFAEDEIFWIKFGCIIYKVERKFVLVNVKS